MLAQPLQHLGPEFLSQENHHANADRLGDLSEKNEAAFRVGEPIGRRKHNDGICSYFLGIASHMQGIAVASDDPGHHQNFALRSINGCLDYSSVLVNIELP